MKFKVGDIVIIRIGSNKGTIGKIKQVDTKRGTCILESEKKKTCVRRINNELKNLVKMDLNIHSSKLAIYIKDIGNGRIGYKHNETGMKIRLASVKGRKIEL